MFSLEKRKFAEHKYSIYLNILKAANKEEGMKQWFYIASKAFEIKSQGQKILPYF